MAILTRNAQMVIVRKDASALPAPEGVAAPVQPKTFLFRANDGDFDRYNDRNKVSGWLLANYNANPIVLLNHDDGSGGFFDPPRPVMPIGKARAYTTPDALMAEIEFDQGDPLALDAQRKVEQGFLNAVSVRYRLTSGKYRENERGGYDSDEQELLEISLVNLPGNQRAVRVKSLDEQIEAVVERVLTRLEARAAEKRDEFDPEAFAKAFAEATLTKMKEL